MQEITTIKENTSEIITNIKEKTGEAIANYVSDLKQNVGDNERIVSAIAGGGLITYGISKGGLFGTTLSLLGGSLTVSRRDRTLPGLRCVGQINAQMSLKAAFRCQRSVTINKSQAELYQFWRNFENLPQFMNHLESVKILDEKRSHWKAKAPLGYSVEWDAETTGEIENEQISWHSVEGSEITNSGVIEFRPTTNRGTEVRVTFTYEPPAGKLGSGLRGFSVKNRRNRSPKIYGVSKV